MILRFWSSYPYFLSAWIAWVSHTPKSVSWLEHEFSRLWQNFESFRYSKGKTQLAEVCDWEWTLRLCQLLAWANVYTTFLQTYKQTSASHFHNHLCSHFHLYPSTHAGYCTLKAAAY